MMKYRSTKSTMMVMARRATGYDDNDDSNTRPRAMKSMMLATARRAAMTMTMEVRRAKTLTMTDRLSANNVPNQCRSFSGTQ